MIELQRTAAGDRLEWILDGLAATTGWGGDITEVLAAAFTAAIAPLDYGEVTRARAAIYAPLTVIAADVGEHTARARLSRPDGAVDVLTCVVDPTAPHRIVRTWLQAEIPADLTPRLPMNFTREDWSGARGGQLIAFAGVPGSGKSTLADAVGARLGIPVFAIDWSLGALTPFGGRHLTDLFGIGYEQLTTLAYRQLMLGQSAGLDAPGEDVATRDRWRSLADAAGGTLRVVVCTCPDEDEHRHRLASRERDIPGWHEGGDWANVSSRLAKFAPWPDALVVDTTR
ncbi:MAG: AAA family ATPase, partial [Jatrophihabitans sp.]